MVSVVVWCLMFARCYLLCCLLLSGVVLCVVRCLLSVVVRCALFVVHCVLLVVCCALCLLAFVCLLCSV